MIPRWRLMPGICAFLALCGAAGCGVHGGLPRPIGDGLASLDSSASASAPSDQLVYVEPDPAFPTRATVYALQRTAFGWEPALAPVG